MPKMFIGKTGADGPATNPKGFVSPTNIGHSHDTT
jgi:hypothetical protein